MSVQVGSFCYATAADAARAACASFEPINAVTSSGDVKNVTCLSSDSAGALNLQVVTTSASGVQSVAYVSESPAFPPCVNQDYIDAVELAIPGLGVIWVLWWAAKKIMSLLDWSRGGDAA